MSECVCVCGWGLVSLLSLLFLALHDYEECRFILLVSGVSSTHVKLTVVMFLERTARSSSYK